MTSYTRSVNFNKRDQRGDKKYAKELLKSFRRESGWNSAAEKPTHNDSGLLNDSSPLKVESISFPYEDNARRHHTEYYDLAPSKPILRRGFPFLINVRFERAYNPKTDRIRFVFNFSRNPIVTKGTRAIVIEKGLKELPEDKHDWGIRILRQDGVDITFEVRIPVLAMVGMWHCSLQMANAKNPNQWAFFEFEDYICILFNPWCKEDGVYMENEELREGYVLSDSGKIKGEDRKNFSWVYGQFDSVVLPAVMYLLEKSGLESSKRGSPVHVSRAISGMLNFEDDDGGLLEGRWKGDFSDGTGPLVWTGSVPIIEQYLNSGCRTVRYGQCWVFAGLAVTVCRAIGIPCRAVTCDGAGVDKDGTLTVDEYLDRNGMPIGRGPDGTDEDYQWNYHVWGEAWMTRPDLPLGYGGWQVVDGCPRRFGDGKKEICGPTSLKAVRQGEVGLLYDTDYVFSEVNADCCTFQEDPESSWGYSLTAVDTEKIGSGIFTMKVGSQEEDNDGSDMEDITYTYKNKEGTNEERQAVMNASRGSTFRGLVYQLPKYDKEDVTFEFMKTEPISLGQYFSVEVLIQNNSESSRSIVCNMTASIVHYTEMNKMKLNRVQSEIELQPGNREKVRIKVKPSEYFKMWSYPSVISVTAIARVKETHQIWTKETTIAFESFKLNIKVPKTVMLGDSIDAIFSFQNTLAVALTGCVFRIEGPGLLRPKEIRIKDVMPGDFLKIEESFTPTKTGQRILVGNISSKQVGRIHGSKYIRVVV